jgi:hypothetical protein
VRAGALELGGVSVEMGMLHNMYKLDIPVCADIIFTDLLNGSDCPVDGDKRVIASKRPGNARHCAYWLEKD